MSHSFRLLLKSPVVWLLAFVAAVFFVRCYLHEPSGDEVLYQYVWEKGDFTNLWQPGHRFERKISSFDQIVNSQQRHYLYANGRCLIHAAEQAFTGHDLVFSILNTAAFLLFIALWIKFCTGAVNGRPYLLWLAVVLTVLFLFPYQESLWTSVNYGLNYLWPSLLTVSCLLIWRLLVRRAVSAGLYTLFGMMFFVVGWSHEGSAIPLAGSLVLYYLIFRQQFKRRMLVIILPLLCGTLINFFAPANSMRYFIMPTLLSSMAFYFCNGIQCLLKLWGFWLWVTLFAVECLRGNFYRIKTFVNSNPKLTLCCLMFWIVPMLVNTDTYTFTFAVLLLYLTTFRYAYLNGIFAAKPYKPYLAAAITLLFVCQQVLLVCDTRTNQQLQHGIKQAYAASSDGIVVVNQPDISPTSAPYIRIFSLDDHPAYLYSIAIEAGTPGKTIIPLSASDFRAIADSANFYIPANKVAGTAAVYRADGGRFLWLKPGTLQPGQQLRTYLHPVKWYQFDILMRNLIKGYGDDNDLICTVDTLDSRYGRYFRITPPRGRSIRRVDIVSPDK